MVAGSPSKRCQRYEPFQEELIRRNEEETPKIGKRHMCERRKREQENSSNCRWSAVKFEVGFNTRVQSNETRFLVRTAHKTLQTSLGAHESCREAVLALSLGLLNLLIALNESTAKPWNLVPQLDEIPRFSYMMEIEFSRWIRHSCLPLSTFVNACQAHFPSRNCSFSRLSDFRTSFLSSKFASFNSREEIHLMPVSMTT